jgi:hypothetical protein
MVGALSCRMLCAQCSLNLRLGGNLALGQGLQQPSFSPATIADRVLPNTPQEFFAHPFLHDSMPASSTAGAPTVEPIPVEQHQLQGVDEAEEPLSEALERTISRWASQHTSSQPAQASVAAGQQASPSKAARTAAAVPGSSPAQKQLFGMSPLQRAASIKNAAGNTVSQLLFGLSPPSLSPLFGRSAPVSRPVPAASSKPQPPPLQQQIGWSSPPQGLTAGGLLPAHAHPHLIPLHWLEPTPSVEAYWTVSASTWQPLTVMALARCT